MSCDSTSKLTVIAAFRPSGLRTRSLAIGSANSEELGFEWRSDSHKEEWVTRFVQLEAYKQRFGHCRVPVKWEENPQLGAWTSKLRQRRKSGTLSPEKDQLLTELGFEDA